MRKHKNARPENRNGTQFDRCGNHTNPAGTGKSEVDIFSDHDDRPERSADWQDDCFNPNAGGAHE